jgi:RNA polymerase sigma-70 factor, ECF subfamily
MTPQNTGELVEQFRGRLFGIAYRMLGQVQEAEDLVQEAYLRWHQADQAGIESPLGWLVAVVTRLSIDRLRRAAIERTTYVGHWLPEPLATDAHLSADYDVSMQADLSIAFLVLLQRLAPEERAAFVLREVFDENYGEIARILDKSEAAARQIVHRARQHVRADRPRFHVKPDDGRELIGRLLSALASDDKDTLLSMFAEEATFTSDGGGKVNATMKPVLGPDRIARLLLGIEAKWPGLDHRLAMINGELGILTYGFEKLFSATALDIVDGRIVAIHRVLNPDKLQQISGGSKDPPLREQGEGP